MNRLCLNQNDQDLVWIQSSWYHENGPGPLPEKYQNKLVSYPFTLISEEYIREALSKDYEVSIQFDDESGLTKIERDYGHAVGYGLLAKRK